MKNTHKKQLLNLEKITITKLTTPQMSKLIAGGGGDDNGGLGGKSTATKVIF